jgi:hypothetical protein
MQLTLKKGIIMVRIEKKGSTSIYGETTYRVFYDRKFMGLVWREWTSAGTLSLWFESETDEGFRTRKEAIEHLISLG